MEEKLNLRDLYKMVKKNVILIFLITIVAMGSSWAVAKYAITPIYQSSTQILVNQAASDNIFDVNVVKSNLELINTYSVIIKSPLVLEEVIKDLRLNKEFEELYEQVTVNNQEDSQVVVVSVEDENPATAVKVANSIAAVFENKIADVMKVDNVNVLYPAKLKEDPQPIKPQPALIVVVSGLAGMFLGLGIAFVRDYFDNTIKSESDIESKLGLSALGAITVIKDHGPTKSVSELKSKKREVGGKIIGS